MLGVFRMGTGATLVWLMRFQLKKARKRNKKYIQRQADNKENTAHVFRCETLLDSLNKQASYSVCIQAFKNLKINSKQGQKCLERKRQNYNLCFSRLKCNKTSGANRITK